MPSKMFYLKMTINRSLSSIDSRLIEHFLIVGATRLLKNLKKFILSINILNDPYDIFSLNNFLTHIFLLLILK